MEPDNQENQNADQQDTAGNVDNQQQATPEVPAWQAILFQQRQQQQRDNERLAQIEAENQRMREQLAAQQQQQQNQPLPTDVLMNNPDAFRQAINQDIQRQVAPLNQFTQEMQRQQNYRIIKGQLMRDPQFGPIVNQVGLLLDDYFLNNPSAVPSVAAITNQCKVIIADYVLAGGLQNQSQNQNNQAQNQNQNQNNQSNQNNQTNQGQIMNPPHLRPSSRPTNQPQNTNQQQSFDENERRLMRENGYTPGEYLMLRDADPSKAAEVWKTIKDARVAGKRIQ